MPPLLVCGRTHCSGRQTPPSCSFLLGQNRSFSRSLRRTSLIQFHTKLVEECGVMEREFSGVQAEKHVCISRAGVRSLYLVLLGVMVLILTVSASAQKPKKQRPANPPAEAEECTSFPQYYCYPSGRPATPPTAAEIDAFDQQAVQAAEHPSPCTVFPEYSCAGGEELWSNTDVISPAEMARLAVINEVCTPFPQWHCSRRSLETEGVLPPASTP